MVTTDLQREIARLHEAAFGWARACCDGHLDDAEDVLQTTYLKILDGRATFKGRSTVRTWLFGVIRKTASEHRRKRWTQRLRQVHAVENDLTANLGAEPYAALASSEEALALLRGLARLSERQRQVMHLVFYQDLTVEQASEVMGISVGSARAHYHRGKQKLRHLLSTGTTP